MHRRIQLALAIALLLFPMVGLADDSPPARRYLFEADSVDAREDLLDASIASATRDVAFLERPFVRMNLREQLDVPRYVDVRYDQGEVTIRFDHEPGVTTPRGETITRQTSDGDEIHYQHDVENGEILQTVRTVSMVRQVRMRITRGGTRLTMSVIVRHDSARHPIRYEVEYLANSNISPMVVRTR